MFYHAYDAYMDNAYPADELMPLSCKGRWKGITPSRGDMDDALGKYVLFFICLLEVASDCYYMGHWVQYVIYWNRARKHTNTLEK